MENWKDEYVNSRTLHKIARALAKQNRINVALCLTGCMLLISIFNMGRDVHDLRD